MGLVQGLDRDLYSGQLRDAIRVSHRVGATLRATGLTSQELASILFVSRRSAQNWRSGLTLPSDDNLRQIETVLGLGDGFFKGEAPLELDKVMVYVDPET